MTATQDDSVTARKNRWHQSTLSTLLDGCSWQYFLTYVLELPQGDKPHAMVGSAFHSAVELHEKNRMIDIATTQREMEINAFEYIKSNLQDTTLVEELCETVKVTLDNWYNKGQREWLMDFRPIGIEPEFTLPLVDNARPIGGYIDAIYCDDSTGTYFIVDHKTAKSFDRWRSGEGHRYQAAMYSAALVLSDEFPEITEMIEMVYMVTRTSTSKRKDFEHTRIVRVMPNLDDVKLLGDRIRAAEDIVSNETFKQRPDWILCSSKWCPFFQGCQVDKTLSGDVTLLKIGMPQQYKEAQSDNNKTEKEV